ncbi:MAG: protein kinase [Myxococcales bacterium]|nr:protein kinase [Myxococcales bacterium]
MSEGESKANVGAPSVSEIRCPSCEHGNTAEARYCSACGVRLGTASLDELEGPASKRATGFGTLSEVRETHSTELPIADPLIGTTVAGRYRIIELLGRGGMGVVYRVEHARIGKLMALKLLTGELGRDEEIVARFKREALMVSKLSHPNTVQVFDFGVSDGLTYLAMEYLRGDDLGHLVRKHGPLDPDRCAKIIIQVCSSLGEAHGLGIVHRDLKPENIFILSGHSESDVVKVLDFGLAKLRESPELGEVTSRGAIVGTPYYMSPEQIRGEAADPRSDVYAIGALMHAVLTGQPVFDAPRPMGVLTKHLTDLPASPSSRFPELAIPRGISGVIMRALEKDPARRFQSVQELQFALISELRGAGATSSVEILLDSGQMHALTRSADDAVTRGEVERYEKKLRRRGLYVWAVLALFMLVTGVVVWQVMKHTGEREAFDGREREPNNVASEATPLPFGELIRGQIGRRMDPERSDRDFYRVQVPQGTRSISIKTTSLPNMALCTYLYRVGIESPLGRYCTGGAARPLNVLALESEPGEYLLAVMQDRDSYAAANEQGPVLENVSDNYELSISSAELTSGSESEPNDTPRDGARVALGGEFRGRLAWVRDVDYVCAEPGSGSARFIVEDSPNLARPRHSVLQVTPAGGPADGIPIRLHRKGTALPPESKHDVAGAWQSPAAPRGVGDACVKLELVPNPHAPLPHPVIAPASDEEYTVRVEAAP